MSGGDPDGDEWDPGQINPLHRAAWQEEDGSRAAAVKAVLDAHTVVDPAGSTSGCRSSESPPHNTLVRADRL